MPETEGVVWEEYHDRSTALMLLGLLQVGIGVLAVLMALLMGLSWFMTLQTLPDAGKMIPMFVSTAVMALAAAGVFMTLGVGSMMARRWARALSLALWGIMLAYGAYMAVYWLFMGSAMATMMDASIKASAASAPPGAAPPPGMGSFMAVFMAAMATVMGIGIPLPFVLFYRSRHVKATCEWRDPVPRWTDSRPVPLLSGAILMFGIAGMTLQQGFSNMLYVGVPVRGATAIAVAVAIAAVCILAAVGLARMRAWGWWVAFITTVLLTIVWLQAAVLGRTDAINMNAYMPENLNVGMASPEFVGYTLWAAGTLYLLVCLYTLWLKRYFTRTPAVLPTA